MTEIQRIQQNLSGVAPELRAEIEALVAAATQQRQPLAVEFVEVTRSDGSVEIMRAEDYQRLTAMDLAHTHLRVLSASEAHARRR